VNTGQTDVVAELLTLNDMPVAGRPGVPVAVINVPAAVMSMAVVMTDCDPPVEVWIDTKVLRSLRQNILNLWLSIAVPLWAIVLQHLSDVDRNRFHLCAVAQVDRWKLDRTMIAISDLVLQIGRKRYLNVGFPFMVFAMSMHISRATIVQSMAGDCVARAKLNVWLSEPSIDRGIGVIPDVDATVVDHFV